MQFIFLIVLALINSGCSLDASLFEQPSTSTPTLTPQPPVVEKTSAPIFCVNGNFDTPVSLGDGQFLVSGDFSKIGSCWYNIYGSSISEVVGKININGTVQKSLPDGRGGFYIAGDFTSVDGVARQGLARLKDDGSLDKDFKPFGNLPAGVTATNRLTVALGSGKLFVAGPFSSLSNPFGAVVDVTTGLSKWPSGVRFENPVTASVSDGNGGFYLAVMGNYQGAEHGSIIHSLCRRQWVVEL